MCNNHAHLKKWKKVVVDQPKNVTMKRRSEFEKKKMITAWFEHMPVHVTAEDVNYYTKNPM